jgi:hypothetical protein
MKMQLIIRVRIMKIFIISTLLLIAGTSCSTNYGNNRVIDARDIFSFSVGYGLGAQARVSYLAEGFLLKKDFAGMENGIPAWYGFDSQATDIEVALGRIHIFNPPYDVYVRKHGVMIAEGPLCFYIPRKEKWNPKWATQIDATLALGLSVKVGFNPGELFDFIFGVFGYDLYNDDYAEEDFSSKAEDKETKDLDNESGDTKKEPGDVDKDD